MRRCREARLKARGVLLKVYHSDCYIDTILIENTTNILGNDYVISLNRTHREINI